MIGQSLLIYHLSRRTALTSMGAYRGFSTTPPQRPFNILGLQQVAVGFLERDKLAKFWVDIMGLKKIGAFKSERENVDEIILELGSGTLGKVEVDLMTPLDPEHLPKVHVPPLNHVGLWVDDLPKCVEYLESKVPN